jgi:hypothetical protein
MERNSVTRVLSYQRTKPAAKLGIILVAEDFSSSLYVQNGSGAHPASCTMGTGGKARPGRDAEHSPPSSAEGVNE